MNNYAEEVKKRIINGDLSKPECLYDLLIKELDEEKSKEVIPWLKNNLSGKSVVDLGGGSGWMIEGLDYENKTVVDKRKFDTFDNVRYVNANITSPAYNYTLNTCTTIISEVLHLLMPHSILSLLESIKSDELIVIENKWDDFLDLRLRLWSDGSCLRPEYMSELLGAEPVASTTNHLIWRIKNG